MIVTFVSGLISLRNAHILLILIITHPHGHLRQRLVLRLDDRQVLRRQGVGVARRGDHRQLMIDTAEKSYSEAKLKSYRRIYPILGFVGRPASYDRFIANAEAILAFDARGGLGDITCPTLVLGGAEDRTVGPEAAGQLHDAIPGSRLHVYPGLGHNAYEEAPDFYRRVFDFLQGA